MDVTGEVGFKRHRHIKKNIQLLICPRDEEFAEISEPSENKWSELSERLNATRCYRRNCLSI